MDKLKSYANDMDGGPEASYKSYIILYLQLNVGHFSVNALSQLVPGFTKKKIKVLLKTTLSYLSFIVFFHALTIINHYTFIMIR